MSVLEQIKLKALEELSQVQTLGEIEEIRIKYLGKKGKLTEFLKSIGGLSPEERKSAGIVANTLKDELSRSFDVAAEELEMKKFREKSSFDITLPGIEFPNGTYHPITIVQREIEDIFRSMGFEVHDTPEVESEYYNFEALNIPKYHPARDMQDTYWLDNGMVLRTQTSAGQVRIMEGSKPPIKAIIPGRCFRNERTDASHENTFCQLEGMVIDEGVSLSNLLYTMKVMLGSVFIREIPVRLRPGYFPFVEPGFELDIQCTICGGAGCPTCKHSGWVELLPCGMVHPRVLEYGGINSEKYTGFAFGLGLTRMAMMKYSIPDIRLFNSGNLKALKQFRQEVL